MTESPDFPNPPADRTRSLAMWAFAALLCLASPAVAAETQWWILDDAADHTESHTEGIVVTPEGTLRLGPRTSSHTDDSLSVLWSAARMADGRIALGSDRGRIRRWSTQRGIEPWLEVSAGQVLALAADGKSLLAGTAPDGLIYRIGERGDTSVFARTGERYVWALAPGRNGVWYAATGTLGRVLRIEGGKTRVVLDTEASNIIALIPDGSGGVYAGGDSHGRVYHVRADGTTRTLFEAEEDEIRALAIGADGALYAAALSSSAVTGALAPAPPPPGGSSAEREERDDDDADASDEIKPTRATRGRAIVYRIVPDSTASAYWSAPAPVVYALARGASGMIAATGNRAGVFTLTRANAALHWLSAPQGQITALLVDGSSAGERVFAAASNPAAVWTIGPGRAERGELISPVLDARRIARLGKVVARGEPHGGRIELSTRTGNTNPPDTTWSTWRAVGNDGAAGSPAGRYAQWRLILAGGDPVVEAVEASWREQNLAPRVSGIVVAPQGAAFREGDLTPRSEPVTQTLPGGQKVSYSVPPASSQRELRDLPAWARGLRTVQWRGSDPNGDPLLYRVDVAPSAEGPWTLVAEDLDQSAFTWDTQSLVDGRYRLRVTASDLPGNAVGEEREDFSVSAPFHIDNTAPSVTELTATGVERGIRVTGTARDGSSPLTRIEVAVDDEDWRVITPEGGFADDLDLVFRATVQPVEPGDHSVGVRAVDRAGNATTRAVRVRVPAPR